MKHNVNEIYSIKRHVSANNFYCTLAYCEANNISIYSYKNNREGQAHQQPYIQGCKGQFKYHDIDGMHIAYLYGEYTWFDTEEERDACRERHNKEQAEQRARNKVKKAILERLDQMSIEELEEVLKKI